MDENDPDYQRFVSKMAEHCRCARSVCAGVLAGGPCDGFDEEWEAEQERLPERSQEERDDELDELEG